ncbi:MAG: LamG domain-containing protein [Pirellulales bacterium]
MRTQSAPLFLALIFGLSARASAEEGLIAHWPLVGDGRDISANEMQATAHAVDFTAAGPSGRERTAAAFDGQAAYLEVPNSDLLQLGRTDFSVAAWVYTDSALDDVPGDILSQYDPQARRGFHLALKSNPGVAFSQANARQLQFGIDQNRAQDGWTDRGRPGNALLAFSLCTFDGQLYAGTCEPGRDESGHVYRYARDDRWIDCGCPDGSNAVTALAVYNGQLYAGTGKYRVAGSSLPESENATIGGRVFRYDGEARWIDCGALPQVEAVGGLAVFRGQLYASSLYRPAGFFRYERDRVWIACEVPVRPDDLPGDTTHMRVEALGVYNGALYATSYDGGRVFRFDGKHWFDCGQLGDNTQTYSLAVRAGRLYVGTWPSGRVYRLEEANQWFDVGRLGGELEVMGMLVHNGRLIAGTLPLAEVYQLDGPSGWKKLTRLDHTPDVRYRRAWCMAEHDGQIFCSTLPSGKIYSWRAGRVAMSNTELPPGWHHVAAVRSGNSLAVFIDGKLTGHEDEFEPSDYDLSNDQPLQIGFGPNDFFKGRLCDVRLYRRALTGVEIQKLATN